MFWYYKLPFILSIALLLLVLSSSCLKLPRNKIHKPIQTGKTNEKAVLPPSWPIEELKLPDGAKKHLLALPLRAGKDFIQDNIDVNDGSGRSWAVGFSTEMKWEEMMQYTWEILADIGYEKDGSIREYRDRPNKYYLRQAFTNTTTNTDVELGYELHPGDIIQPDMDGYFFEITIWK